MRLVEEQVQRTPRPGVPRAPLHDSNWRAVIVDGFAECANFPLRKGVFLYGPAIKHSPRLYSRLFHMTNSVHRFNAAYRLSQPFLRQGITELLLRTRPDVIVSVHPLLNHITLQAMRELGLRLPFITVITDLVSIHTAWVAPGVTACVVPTEAARDYAIAAGVAAKRVRLLGMPIDPAFSTQPTAPLAARRAALGLDPDLPMILLVGGGEGAGGLRQAAYALSRLTLDAQLVIVTGRNRTLYHTLQEEKQSFSMPTTILGFVQNMPELMHAADLVATKAGPGSISEAMACGLPIVLTGYIPGQEEGNVEYVLSNHIGVLAETPAQVASAVRSLLAPGTSSADDRATLEAMRANIARLSHPRASFEIARLILSYVPAVGATSAWAGVQRTQRSRLARALGRRRTAVRGASRLARLRTSRAWSRRGLALPTLDGARSLLQRGALLGATPTRRGPDDQWR